MSEEATVEEFADTSETESNGTDEKTPEGWDEVSIIDLCEMGGGSTPKKSNTDYWEGGEVLWTTPKDFDGPRLKDTEDKMTERGAEESHSKIYPAGTILLVVRSGVLRHTLPVSIAEEPTTVNQDLKALEPDRERINAEYFFQALSGLSEDIRGSCKKTGTTVESIQTSVLKQYPVPVPPLEVQRKIATVLSTVDRAVQKTEEIIEQMERVQRGIEQRLFQQGYFDHSDTQEQRLVTIPSGWEFEQLSKHTKDSAFGPRFNSDRYDEDGSVATLRTTDLDDRGNITPETMPIANLEQSEIEEHLLKPGDFMITRSGTTGIGTVWEEYEKPTIPGAFLIRFRFKESISPLFMKYYANSHLGRKRINRRAKGGVQKNLAGSDLLNMRFPIPSVEEQEKIVEVLDATEKRINSEHELKNELHRLKQGLMQDLLSGAVRIHETDIEVPEAVLAQD